MTPSGNHSSAKTDSPLAERVSPTQADPSPGILEVNPHYVISDEVADEIVADLREIENVAHE